MSIEDKENKLCIVEETDGLIHICSEICMKNKDTISKNGITHIVNCTNDIKNIYEKDGVKYCQVEIDEDKFFQVPVRDYPNEEISGYFNQIFEFCDNAEKNKGKILFHCKQGVSRSGSFVIAYLMKRNKIKLIEALGLVRRSRPIVLPNLGFIRQLRNYESLLHSKESNFDLFEYDIEWICKAFPLYAKESRVRNLMVKHNGDSDVVVDSLFVDEKIKD